MHRLIASVRRLPLARKILLINGVVAFATWSLVVGLILADQYRLARHEVRERARLLVDAASRELEGAYPSGHWVRAPEVLAELRAKPYVTSSAVYDKQGELLMGASEASAVPLSRAVTESPEVVMGSIAIEASQVVRAGSSPVGTVVVWIDTSTLFGKVLRDSYSLIVVATVGSATVLLFIWLLLPVSLRRMGRLTQTVRTVTQEGNYAIRAEVQGSDEIGELAAAFNSMLNQIQSREASLRQELVERQRAQKQTAYLASHDVVTGLPNRRFFNDALDHALAAQDGTSKRMVAVVLVDIDNFKMVNDSLGHRAGDQLLTETGIRIRSIIAEHDLVCRVGGDEYAVILVNVQNEAQAEEIGGNIHHALATPMHFAGTEVILGTSLGIALSRAGTTADDLMRNADTAMHQAKAAGKGLVRIFRTYMNDRVQHRLTLEQDLRKALDQNQLSLHYQPQVDTASGKVVAVEALMRWNHPRLGSISPAQFIPIAEESGLIVPMGAWALRRASTDAKEWQTQGLHGVSVSVNVSARQFIEPAFLSTVLSALYQSGLDGSLLELELTESLLFDQHGSGMNNLAALRERGIALAIDDFGTGYSSMAYLKRFPLQRLKIDRGFIKNIPHETDDMAIAGAMIALGHKLGMEIVAEGVENRAQYNFLVDQTCDRIQGFLFSKPLPLDELLSTYARPRVVSVESVPQRLTA